MRSALEVLIDPRADDDDRLTAAWIVRCTFGRSSATEAMIADVAGALRHAVDAPGTVPLLSAALRSRAVDRSRVAGAFACAADHALTHGHLAGLHEVVLEALDEPTWSGRIREEHGVAALGWALDDLPGRRTEALLAIGSWLLVRDGVPYWMREAVRDRPGVFALLRPPPSAGWTLHCAVPSTHGWIHLAQMRERERETFVITREAFIGEIESAITTLEQAVAQQQEGATRVVLAGWFARLA
jgi:hypothetical protein